MEPLLRKGFLPQSVCNSEAIKIQGIVLSSSFLPDIRPDRYAMWTLSENVDE